MAKPPKTQEVHLNRDLPEWLFPALAWILVLAATFHYASFVTADPDLWGHVKFGEHHWHSGEMERFDPYSFTAAGRSWINHEWITELVFYGLFALGGSTALLAFKLVLGLALAALLMAACGQKFFNPLVRAAVVVLAVRCIGHGFMMRPQLFSYLAYAGFLFFILQYMEKGINRLYVLPLITVLWVNLHGGFLMGIAVFGLITGIETLAVVFRKENPQVMKTLWLWFLVSCLATLANPYGPALHVFLFKSLTVSRPITEWAPLPLFAPTLPEVKIFFLLTLAAVLIRGRSNRGYAIAAIAATAYAAVKHQRHLPFFAMTAAPFVTDSFSALLRRVRRERPSWVPGKTARMIVAAGVLILSVQQVAIGAATYVRARARIVVDPDVYPVGAVRFLKVNQAKGNLFVVFDWGEYAIWKLFPDCRVSIDGRFRTAYPESVIQDHFAAEENLEGLKNLLEKYPGDILLIRQGPLARKLIERPLPEWMYVYSDSTSVVFFKKNLNNDPFFKTLRQGRLVYPKEALPPYFP